MRYDDNIPEKLFREDGHYLGKPANFDDRIISRRVRLVEKTPGYCDKNADLLDIGCGNGASMFLLSKHMKSCTGIEVTDEHLPEFNQFKQQNQIDNCTCEIKDVCATSATKQYDRLLSFEVIEHLSDEDKGLQFYYDSLKPDGMMIISVPNKWWIFETHGAKLPLLPWNRVPLFSWLPRPIHERLANARIYTRRRIFKLLRKHNFEIIDYKYVMAPMDVLPDGSFKNWVIKNFFQKDTTTNPVKSPAIFVVAKKV